MAQPIRYLLFYLDLPFDEILLKAGQNPHDLEIIKNAHTYGTMDLPYLVHGTKCIQSFFAIFIYLCTTTGREDLLGSNLEERTFVREVFYNFLLAKKQ